MSIHLAMASQDRAPAFPSLSSCRSQVSCYHHTQRQSPHISLPSQRRTFHHKANGEAAIHQTFLLCFLSTVFTQWVSLNLKVWISTFRNVEKCFRHFYGLGDGHWPALWQNQALIQGLSKWGQYWKMSPSVYPLLHHFLFHGTHKATNKWDHKFLFLDLRQGRLGHWVADTLGVVM